MNALSARSMCGRDRTPQDDSVFLAAGRAALAAFKGA